jgi:hypothetical protein
MSTNETTVKNTSDAVVRPASLWARDRLDQMLDIFATVLLSIGAVATAWSGYQAARWSGVQASKYSEANKLRIESTRASTKVGQQQAIDVLLFANWLNAFVSGNTELEMFYRQRFRPEFMQAFEAWLKTSPRRNPAAPTSPFAMPEYHLEQNEKAAQLDEASARAFKEAEAANEQGDAYVLQTVTLAAMLFFVGISQQVRWLPGRALMVLIGVLMCIWGIYKIVTYQVE